MTLHDLGSGGARYAPARRGSEMQSAGDIIRELGNVIPTAKAEETPAQRAARLRAEGYTGTLYLGVHCGREIVSTLEETLCPICRSAMRGDAYQEAR